MHAIASMSMPAITSARFCGRYGKHGLMIEGWKDRLFEAIKKKGTSPRKVSLAAGAHANALSELKTTEKEPGFERVMKFIEAAGVSANYVLFANDIPPDEEEILRRYAKIPDKKKREALLALLRAETPDEQPEGKPVSSQGQERDSAPKSPE